MAIIRIARIWPGAQRAAAAAAAAPSIVPVDVDPSLDSLDAFGSETIALAPALTFAPRPVPAAAPVAAFEPVAAPVAESEPVRRDWTNVRVGLRWVGVIALSAATTAAGMWAYRQKTAVAPTGSVTIQTTPAGLPVRIDDRPAGLTPLTVTLAPASYAIAVGDAAQRRDLTVTVVAGSSVIQHLELVAAGPASAAPATGALLVQTEPAGQIVAIDGVERGASPLTIDALTAGDHTVVVRGARGIVRRSVAVKAGETVSLLVTPVAPATPAPGWLSVQSTTRLELRESGKLLGTTETEKIMLAAGTYDIELVNEAIGFRARREIEVVPGRTTTLPVELPYGSVSINAQPWAEVWINGDRIGETPIANLARRIGSYDVVFRHPELGERRETINVTLRQPARLGVDMRSKQQ